MARLMGHKFRITILVITMLCLSMMLANVLTLNFSILCMSEEKFRWENFTIDLGIDVFERVDFRSTRQPDDLPARRPETEADARTPSLPGFPDVEIPGIRIPTPGFNWQSFRLARQNPQLFLRLMKTIILQVGELAARRTGEEFDPRNIDFRLFQNGFNLTDLNKDVILRVRDYVLRKVQLARNAYDILDVEGRNVSQWRNVTVNDIQLRSITWNGVLSGQIRVLERAADYKYSDAEKAWLFAIIAVGALVAIPFVSGAIRRFGCRKTFTVVGLISAASTALCPAAAHCGFVVLLIVRCIQGIGFAACMPVIGAVTSTWAKLTENGLFNGALTCFIQLAPVITMPISGIFCMSALRWPAIYYLHAIVTFIAISIWCYLYRDQPSESQHVHNSELRKIQSGKVIDGRQKHNRSKLPLREICRNRSVLAVWVAAVANMYAIETLILFGAIYINTVLRFPLVSVGFVTAFPTLLQFAVKIMAGTLSDRALARFTERRKLQVFNTIAFVGMAVGFLLLAVCPLLDSFANGAHIGVGEVSIGEYHEGHWWRYPALMLLIVTAAVLGFNVGGFFKSATLIGREYAYFINTVVQVIMCIAMLTVPFLVVALTGLDAQPAGWSVLFTLLAVLLLAGNVVFVWFGQAVAASFTHAVKASAAPASAAAETTTEQIRPIISGPMPAAVPPPA